MLKLKLKPGVISYYEPLSNVYLTIDRNIAEVEEGTNLTGLRKSYRNKDACSFIVIEGTIEDTDSSDKKIEQEDKKENKDSVKEAPKPKRTQNKSNNESKQKCSGKKNVE